ncbi:MAG: hypothetical protein JO235_17485 [Chroococcidiopsidaceae cyanobacterium CP_BM_RX_35]|nr:hypothetical protein [Chroococcidiopsidaceae cyanobacterium CP_BM_RX_35]
MFFEPQRSQPRAGVPPVEKGAPCGASAEDGFPVAGDWRWGSPRCSDSRRTGVRGERRERERRVWEFR